jgi:hypothetical protein
LNVIAIVSGIAVASHCDDDSGGGGDFAYTITSFLRYVNIT